MPDLTISKNQIKEIVKLHQKKYRDEKGLFIIEGYKALKEIIDNNIEICNIYVLKGSNIQHLPENTILIDEYIMKKLTTTNSVCEILAVAKKKKTEKTIFNNMTKIALFEEISDPGNLGTILRSASAFNIDGIILFGDCVDLYSTKVIRSAVGNMFKTPVLEIKNTAELKNLLPKHTFISTALSKHNNIEIKDCQNFKKIVIMFGSEAKGLSQNILNITDKNIKIEMNKNVESLNLSVSASIIFYELNKFL